MAAVLAQKKSFVTPQKNKRTTGTDFGSFSCGKTKARDLLIDYREAIHVSQRSHRSHQDQ
jgi:hypothetical protein